MVRCDLRLLSTNRFIKRLHLLPFFIGLWGLRWNQSGRGDKCDRSNQKTPVHSEVIK